MEFYGSNDCQLAIAGIGAGGVIVGAGLTICGQLLIDKIRRIPKQRLDKRRQQLLISMLEDTRFKWRKLETLSRVVGADEEETKRLLIQIGARGSELDDNLWGLIKKHPFKEIDDQ